MTVQSDDRYERMSREDLIRAIAERDGRDAGATRLTYPGQAPPWQIVRRVKPRSQKIQKKLCVGDEAAQTRNLIVEGENLQAMVTLYKYRGGVDLVFADPPYNTGNDFRYNDRWDEDPNDPDLGTLVPADDGSRHAKWLRFMTPRLYMMKEVLKLGGVLAICIDHRELFRLGVLLDEMFGEENRLGILNWQKAHSPKNASTHVSSATEYVLVYAKGPRGRERARTGLLERDDEMNRGFRNPDGDLNGDWLGKDATAPDHRRLTAYAVQSPFTGALHYPSGEFRFDGRVPDAADHWRGFTKADAKRDLESWGWPYEERDLGDGRGRALVLRGSAVCLDGYDPALDPIVAGAQSRAVARLEAGSWPFLYFRDDRGGERGPGAGRPRIKGYLRDVKQGKVPMTYWADEVYEEPIALGSQSWPHAESGHSQDATKELDALLGPGHNFKTVKPLKLVKKIVQLWCPPSGIVLDPFAGSGTTGHAVLALNAETKSQRRFVLVEQGRPERGDPYARGLTAERIRRAITGERVDGDGRPATPAAPLPGGFRFSTLMSQVDGNAVLALEREEMVDLLLTTHWDQNERNAAHLHRLAAGTHAYLFAKNARNEGYFLVWTGPKNPSVLNRETFRAIAREAQAEGLATPLHVYARIASYPGPNVEFYQIPNRILEKLGFNEAAHPYGVPSAAPLIASSEGTPESVSEPLAEPARDHDVPAGTPRRARNAGANAGADVAPFAGAAA